MSELLQKVLTDTSVRNKTALRKAAAQNAQLGLGWSGNEPVM